MTAAPRTRNNAASDFPEGALPLVRTVFGALHRDGVRYCHWKSTTGLPIAVAGRTDLDLLVDRADAARFTAVVREAGFKPFNSHGSRRFVGVEDWLGHDLESNRLVHLHVYYRLVLGEDYVKNHVLPIEAALLDDVVTRYGLKVPAPASELTVLIVRTLLKYRRTDAAKDALGLGRRGGIPPNMRAEIADLAARVSADDLHDAAGRLLPSMRPGIFTEFVDVLRVNHRDARELLRLRAETRRALKSYERLPAGAAMAISVGARLQRAPGLRRILRPRTKADLRRKTSAAGGLTVALIGADGAGKSTVIEEIVQWLGWRLSLRVLYLGTARPSATTAAIQGVSRVVKRFAGAMQPRSGSASGSLPSLPKLVAALRYLAEARDRERRGREGHRLAAQGALVLFDRYPLPWVRLATRPVDGPRIAELGDHGRGPLAALRRWEERIYARIASPDLVILLTVDPAVALGRKESANPDSIAAKATAVRDAAARASGDGVVAIDASQPLAEVVRTVEAEIWRRL